MNRSNDWRTFWHDNLEFRHLMNRSDWKNYWEGQADRSGSDFEFDRGTCPRSKEVETCSSRELLDFIEPQPWEVIFDAGCGTGVNILLLHSKVKRIIGMDYSEGAMARCKRRILSNKIENVELIHGDITHVPIADNSVDKILGMSVLQYLNDVEVRSLLGEFVRILKDQGTVILHVKNISSLYLSTLWVAKKLKILLGSKTRLEHFRSYSWYARQLKSFGFEVVNYNSFNLFVIESMPKRLLQFFQRLELEHYNKFPMRIAFLRRHGSELKIKARVTKTH